MFSVAQVLESVKADLDAEGSDRYLWDQDYKPAINKAIRWMTSALSQVLSVSRSAGENLRDLKRTSVWVSSGMSRVAMNASDIGHAVWTVIDVIPEPEVFPSVSVGAINNKAQSKFLDKVTFLRSDYSAARLTEGQWNNTSKNEFVPGNSVLSGNVGLKSYAYLDFNKYPSGRYTLPEDREIEIRPTYANKLVAIRYLKVPSEVSDESDNIEFPDSIVQIFSEKVANFISKKQGDETTLFAVSNQDIQTLLQLIS